MQEWIIQTMEQFGYLGIFLLITIENLFPPIPSEIILTFGGFMTTYTKSTRLRVILSATIDQYQVPLFFTESEDYSLDLLAKILMVKQEKFYDLKKKMFLKLAIGLTARENGSIVSMCSHREKLNFYPRWHG